MDYLGDSHASGSMQAAAGPVKSHHCVACRKDFSSARNLSRHLASHSDERNFKCDHCDKSFNRSDLLIRHTRQHELKKGGIKTESVERSSSPPLMNPALPSLPPLPLQHQYQHHQHHQPSQAQQYLYPQPQYQPPPPPPPPPSIPHPYHQQPQMHPSYHDPPSHHVFSDAFNRHIEHSLLERTSYTQHPPPPLPPPPVPFQTGYAPPGPQNAMSWAGLQQQGYSGGGEGAGPVGGVGWNEWDTSLSWLLEGAPNATQQQQPQEQQQQRQQQRQQQQQHQSHSSASQSRPNVSAEPSPSVASSSSHQSHDNLDLLQILANTAVSSTPSAPERGEDERDANWPTHFDPAAAASASETSTSQRGGQPPAFLPDLPTPAEGSERWRDFWIDETTLARVRAVVDIARYLGRAPERSVPLPSSLHTLNRFVSLYLENVLPMFPVLHLPTFSITQCNPVVLSAIIATGAIFSTLPGASAFSLQLCDDIRRALGALYEHESTKANLALLVLPLFSSLRNEQIIHASVLICVAGLWSGDTRSFELAEVSRGQLVNLCRRGRLLDCPVTFQPDNIDINVKWTSWAASESRKRLGVSIMLLDGFFPSLLSTPSYLSQGELLGLVLPCDERFWSAGSAHMWSRMLGAAPIPPSPFFSSSISSLLTPRYVLHRNAPDPHQNALSRLLLVVALSHHTFELQSQLSVYTAVEMVVPQYKAGESEEGDMMLGFEGRKQWLDDALVLWKDCYYGGQTDDPHLLWAQVLYHMGHITLNVDVRELHRAAGQYGPRAASEATNGLSRWSKTPVAEAAALEALSLLSVVHRFYSGPLPYRSSPSSSPPLARSAIGPYAPLATFAATLVLWVYLGLGDPTALVAPAADSPWTPSRLATLRGMLGGLAFDSPEAPMAVRRFGAGLEARMTSWKIAASLRQILLRSD